MIVSHSYDISTTRIDNYDHIHSNLIVSSLTDDIILSILCSVSIRNLTHLSKFIAKQHYFKSRILVNENRSYIM